METKTILPILWMIVLAAFAEACIEPTDGMYITEDTELCSGSYGLPNGIDMVEDDIIIDCNGAEIEGSLIPEKGGINIAGYYGVTVKNCRIRGYEYGIYLADSFENVLEGNEITDNAVGVYMLEAFADMYGNILMNNAEDTVEYTRPGKQMIERESKKTVVEVVEPPVVEFENDVDESKVDGLGVREGYDRAKDIIEITRKRESKNGDIEYSIKVKAEWDVFGLELYEIIPKEMAENASIIESDTPFEVIEKDPEIVFRLGDLEEGEEEVVVYRISKPELAHLNPFSIASVEHAINPTDSKIIRFLFASALIVFLINHFLKREINITKTRCSD